MGDKKKLTQEKQSQIVNNKDMFIKIAAIVINACSIHVLKFQFNWKIQTVKITIFHKNIVSWNC